MDKLSTLKDQAEQQALGWELGSTCNECKQDFFILKLMFRHHCRFCLKSICGWCSKGQLDGHRICDGCKGDGDAEVDARATPSDEHRTIREEIARQRGGRAHRRECACAAADDGGGSQKHLSALAASVVRSAHRVAPYTSRNIGSRCVSVANIFFDCC